MTTDLATRQNSGQRLGATLMSYATAMMGRAEAIIAAQGRQISALEDLAMIDRVTGLKNRRGLYDVFARELALCQRELSCGGLLITVELDNYALVKARYGRMAGDAFLRLTAGALIHAVRQMDVAARTGDDEFVLLLSTTTKTAGACEAAIRAQDIARQLNNLALAWYGEVIPVQASFSLKSYGKGTSPALLFSAAECRAFEARPEVVTEEEIKS